MMHGQTNIKFRKDCVKYKTIFSNYHFYIKNLSGQWIGSKCLSIDHPYFQVSSICPLMHGDTRNICFSVKTGNTAGQAN